jgi:hypothetical protein
MSPFSRPAARLMPVDELAPYLRMHVCITPVLGAGPHMYLCLTYPSDSIHPFRQYGAALLTSTDVSPLRQQQQLEASRR